MGTPERAHPIALHERAADNLRFIRETMERATAFTALSGSGFVLVGLTAVLASGAAAIQPTPGRWLGVWVGELVLAGMISVGTTARKARAQGVALRSHTARKLLLAFAPPMVAGALLTAAAFRGGNMWLLPGLWLVLYGAGVMTGGAYSVRVVPLMGSVFIGVGGLALLVPGWGDELLALGLGGLHVVLGALIWRRHGG